MGKRPLHDSERFSDPLGDHMQAVLAAHEQRMGRATPVVGAYQGFYAGFRPQDKEGTDFLSGAEAIIGTEFRLRPSGDALGLVAYGGRQVAELDGVLSTRLAALLGQGWVVRCFLAYVIYNAEEKSFKGELACFCYHSQLDEGAKQALEVFIHNIVGRIASATHPRLALTQEQFVRVIESKGAWFLTKEDPWPELSKGSVFYRRRKTFNDRLIGAALKGNKGCLAASWIGTVLVVMAVLATVWFFFFR
jgi:hypothetical protein